MTDITAFANHKGGVYKTTQVTMLAAELAIRGRRVLAVDLDPQGNLSRRMGYQEYELAERATTAEAVAAASPAVMASALLPCQWEPAWAANIELAPSRIELENRVSEAGVPGAWRRLRKALDGVAAEYDDVLIDTPPTLGHLLHLALVAADYVIAPTIPEYDSVRGVHRLQAFVTDEEQRDSLGMRTRLIGIIIAGKRSGVGVHDERTTQVVDTWGDLVWQPTIPLRAGVAEASELAEPLHNARGDAGVMIRAAASDITDRYLKEIGH